MLTTTAIAFILCSIKRKFRMRSFVPQDDNSGCRVSCVLKCLKCHFLEKTLVRNVISLKRFSELYFYTPTCHADEGSISFVAQFHFFETSF